MKKKMITIIFQIWIAFYTSAIIAAAIAFGEGGILEIIGNLIPATFVIILGVGSTLLINYDIILRIDAKEKGFSI